MSSGVVGTLESGQQRLLNLSMRTICVSIFLVCISRLVAVAEVIEGVDPKTIIQKIRSAYTGYFAEAQSGEGEARVTRRVQTSDGGRTDINYTASFKFSREFCRFNSVSSMDPEERVEVLLTEDRAFVYLIDDARVDVTARKNFDELETGDYLPITPASMIGFVGHDIFGILGYFEKADQLTVESGPEKGLNLMRAKYEDPLRGEARIIISAETSLIQQYFFYSSVRGGWQKNLSVQWKKFGAALFPVAFTLTEQVATGDSVELTIQLVRFNLNPSIAASAFSPKALPLHDGVIVYDLVEKKKYYWGKPDKYDLPTK
jgi:hypothetical protein